MHYCLSSSEVGRIRKSLPHSSRCENFSSQAVTSRPLQEQTWKKLEYQMP
jgi:hypothetical protein